MKSLAQRISISPNFTVSYEGLFNSKGWITGSTNSSICMSKLYPNYNAPSTVCTNFASVNLVVTKFACVFFNQRAV